MDQPKKEQRPHGLLNMLANGGRGINERDLSSPDSWTIAFCNDMRDVLAGGKASRTLRTGFLVEKDGHEYWFSGVDVPAKQIHSVNAYQVIGFCRYFFDTGLGDDMFHDIWLDVFESQKSVTRHICNAVFKGIQCCKHIEIGSRKENETDKAFHYFVYHADPVVRKKFLEFLAQCPSLAIENKIYNPNSKSDDL